VVQPDYVFWWGQHVARPRARGQSWKTRNGESGTCGGRQMEKF